MRPAGEQVIERLDPVVGDDDLVRHVVLPERPKGEEFIVRIVLYKEDDPFAHRVPNPSAAVVFRYGIPPSDYATRSFYPFRDVRVTVLHTLAHLVGRVTTVGQGHDAEHERQRDQHDGGYAERHYREDYRNEGVNDKDDDPGYLVPERLQGVEAHLPGTVLV